MQGYDAFHGVSSRVAEWVYRAALLVQFRLFIQVGRPFNSAAIINVSKK
jgi:hypothetical protein